jgi:hypothetical protein
MPDVRLGEDVQDYQAPAHNSLLLLLRWLVTVAVAELEAVWSAQVCPFQKPVVCGVSCAPMHNASKSAILG